MNLSQLNEQLSSVPSRQILKDALNGVPAQAPPKEQILLYMAIQEMMLSHLETICGLEVSVQPTVWASSTGPRIRTTYEVSLKILENRMRAVQFKRDHELAEEGAQIARDSAVSSSKSAFAAGCSVIVAGVAIAMQIFSQAGDNEIPVVLSQPVELGPVVIDESSIAPLIVALRDWGSQSTPETSVEYPQQSEETESQSVVFPASVPAEVLAVEPAALDSEQ